MRIHSLSHIIDRRTLLLVGLLGTVVLCVAAATIASAQGLDSSRVRAQVGAMARVARSLRYGAH